ncbi:MAG: hypothetical protein LCH32_12545 [Bacteroidetes bacterium]|mgnify:CR=1 FL=1|nr:hypothetical protein [Bacteroidota bacterium]
MFAKLKTYKYGFFSFLIVLLFMPIGHALMVLNEKLFEHYKFIGAFVIGFIGIISLIIGIIKNKNQFAATLYGLLAGVLVWTGWVEFSFVWIAEKLNVAPLIENGEIATKPEYLVMMSSLGLLLTFLVFFILKQTNCQFFIWVQNLIGLRKYIKQEASSNKPFAILTFIETIVILWTFYIVLLLVYDNDIAGDKHPATYFVAFGSLFWSLYLTLKLIKIQKFDYAIRYAVPTVIIFWNFIEVIGRWDLMKEIWIHPFEHWLENLIILALLVFFIGYYVTEMYVSKTKKIIKPN